MTWILLLLMHQSKGFFRRAPITSRWFGWWIILPWNLRSISSIILTKVILLTLPILIWINILQHHFVLLTLRQQYFLTLTVGIELCVIWIVVSLGFYLVDRAELLILYLIGVAGVGAALVELEIYELVSSRWLLIINHSWSGAIHVFHRSFHGIPCYKLALFRNAASILIVSFQD